MKKSLPMNLKCLALRYKSITKCSLKESFRWAKGHYNEFNKYAAFHWDKARYQKNDKYLEKEFLFRGFVPLDSFNKKPGYNYIQSNTVINGTMYIYPKHCYNMYQKDHEYDNPYELHNDIGIPGYTKVDVKYKL